MGVGGWVVWCGGVGGHLVLQSSAIDLRKYAQQLFGGGRAVDVGCKNERVCVCSAKAWQLRAEGANEVLVVWKVHTRRINILPTQPSLSSLSFLSTSSHLEVGTNKQMNTSPPSPNPATRYPAAPKNKMKNKKKMKKKKMRLMAQEKAARQG